MATLIRTVVILVVLSVFVYATGKWTNPYELSTKTWVFLVLSGLATGASWTFYFRALKVGEASSVCGVMLPACGCPQRSASALHRQFEDVGDLPLEAMLQAVGVAHQRRGAGVTEGDSAENPSMSVSKS